MKYTSVMGLEIHAELLCESKVFCSCRNEFGGEPNTRVCPVCSGMPGALPVLNKNAVTLAVKAGLCLGCKINSISAFDRKNYFYPDLPKAYQITQQEKPICSNGIVVIGSKEIRINRIHIEEDAGKLIHDENNKVTLVDFNRCGVPLIEIVTEADFTTADEVCRFIEEVCLRLKYADVCNARLEEGSLRVDVNISVMPEGSDKFGTRAEIKNLNSLKSVSKAIAYETQRQIELIESGQAVIQETRRFDEKSGKTFAMRSKEDSRDYRYFPEPDLPQIHISSEDIEEIRKTLPQMPAQRLSRYVNDFGLSAEDSALIIKNKEFSDFYDKATEHFSDYKGIANMMLGELNRHLNNSGITLSQLKFTPKMLADLVKMSSEKRITKNAAKDIFAIMFETGEKPEETAVKNNLLTEDKTDEIIKAVKQVLNENTENVKCYKEGKTQLFGYFMGQAVRIIGKSTNPVTVKEILQKILSEK